MSPKEDSKWVFYTFGDYHRLNERLNESSSSLESTTVLLEDSVSRGDPNWIFYYSGDYHGLTGGPN